MNHEQATVKIAAYYKEPMRSIITIDETGNEKTVPNIRIKENHAWLVSNVAEVNLDIFCNRLLRSFHPTSTCPYPLVSDLEKCAYSEPSPERIGPDNRLTMEGMADAFHEANEIPKEARVPEGATVGEVYQIVQRYNAMNKEVVKMYGVFGALKAWALFKAINEGEEVSREMQFSQWKHFTDKCAINTPLRD